MALVEQVAFLTVHQAQAALAAQAVQMVLVELMELLMAQAA